MTSELSLIERLRICFNAQSQDIRDLCSEAAEELECTIQQRDDLEHNLNQWLRVLVERGDECNELEAKLAAVTAERDALAGQVEDLEWENKGIDEWRDLYTKSQAALRTMKQFHALAEQQVDYLMEEREQDIEQIAQLTVALNQAHKFVNEICTVGGAYGYHQGALVADARQLMGQLEKAKGSK